MIRTENLTKAYNGNKAVDNLNLEIAEGIAFGFLGLNGAGKTTTVRMLATINPKEVTSLKPGESETFTMKITPPGDITPSDYKVTVKIKSDQLEEEEDFRIIVEESSNVAIYGVVIIIIVILALAFMFRKYGRR